jgi:phosphatidylglycerophosphate synthase
MTTTSSNPGRPIAAPRRVLATRDAGWARQLARRLAAVHVTPNAISLGSIGCAAAAGLAFYASAFVASDVRWALLLPAAACIQLRLLCNLLDGMLAVEEGLKSATGEIFNELPDRVADVVILVGAGYAVPGVPFMPALGWLAAVLALLTAYVRALAGSLGLTQHFVGPMAKQHRMFTLTVAALVAAIGSLAGVETNAIVAGLAIIVAGCIATLVRRTARMLQELRHAHGEDPRQAQVRETP